MGEQEYESVELMSICDHEIHLWAYPEGLSLHAEGDGGDGYGYESGGGAAAINWSEVLKHAPAEAIATVVLERQDVIDLIDSATMHNELLDRDRRAYRGE